MADETIAERIRELALEMRDNLETNMLRDHRETDEAAERFLEIKREIESYGFFVTWSVSLAQDLESVSAVVNVYKPKENLSPEDQAIYDNWLLGQRTSPPKK